MTGQRIEWPDPERLLADVTPPGCRWFLPARADIARVIELIETYGETEAGFESCHLLEAFYEREVALRDASDARSRSVFSVGLERDGRVIAFASVEYASRQGLLSGRLGVVAPVARGGGIGRLLGGVIPERVGRFIGAEILMSYVTLSHPISQRVLRDAGYQLVGVVPGHDRALVARNTVKRVWEACYVKLLVAPEGVCKPPTTGLLPETAVLIRALGL